MATQKCIDILESVSETLRDDTVPEADKMDSVMAFIHEEGQTTEAFAVAASLCSALRTAVSLGEIDEDTSKLEDSKIHRNGLQCKTAADQVSSFQTVTQNLHDAIGNAARNSTSVTDAIESVSLLANGNDPWLDQKHRIEARVARQKEIKRQSNKEKKKEEVNKQKKKDRSSLSFLSSTSTTRLADLSRSRFAW